MHYSEGLRLLGFQLLGCYCRRRLPIYESDATRKAPHWRFVLSLVLQDFRMNRSIPLSERKPVDMSQLLSPQMQQQARSGFRARHPLGVLGLPAPASLQSPIFYRIFYRCLPGLPYSQNHATCLDIDVDMTTAHGDTFQDSAVTSTS